MATFSTSLSHREVGTYMLNAILAGLSTWLDNTMAVWPHPVPHHRDTYAYLVHDAFYQQDTIGWSNMFRGRFSTTWMLAYDLRNESRSLDRNQYRSHALGPILVEHLWSLSLSLWKERCDAMYGTEGLLTLRNMEELISRITTAYNDPTPIPPTLRSSLFTIPIDTLLSRSLTVRQQWLAHYDRLCVFADAVMAPDEPLPRNRTLHSFFRQFPREPEIDPPPD